MTKNSFIYKTERPWPNRRLSIGAIVGHTTINSTKLWVRTGRPGFFKILIYPLAKDNSGQLRKSFTKVPFNTKKLPDWVMTYPITIEDYGDDTTFVQTIEQLLPYTDYGYALVGPDSASNERIILGQDRLRDKLAYSFRTLSDSAKTMSFGFFSCHMPYSKSLFGEVRVENMEMWESFNATLLRHRKLGDLAFVIGGGDQVYTDGVDKLSIWKYLNTCLAKNPKAIPSKKAMLSWYRDIYRGYWGFPQVMDVFSQNPTYMVWDDHEFGDGWGSRIFKEGARKDEMDEVFPEWKTLGISYEKCQKILTKMGSCAKQVYREYQHSHNPDNRFYDYAFDTNGSAFYFLDGRSHRDVNAREYRVLGEAQIKRFERWLDALDPEKTPFVFITSAIPLMHLQSTLVNADNFVVDLANVEDDLRDSWEHKLHDKERKALIKMLFKAAARGLKVSILSGDVHISAAFRMTDDAGNHIYQLTSSAITYNVSRLMGWALSRGVVDEGVSEDGYRFKRLALYTERNYALVSVNADKGTADFQLYGPQRVSDPHNVEDDSGVTHAMVKIELSF